MRIPNPSSKARITAAFSPAGTSKPPGLDMPKTKLLPSKKKRLPNIGGLGGMTTMQLKGAQR